MAQLRSVLLNLLAQSLVFPHLRIIFAPSLVRFLVRPTVSWLGPVPRFTSTGVASTRVTSTPVTSTPVTSTRVTSTRVTSGRIEILNILPSTESTGMLVYTWRRRLHEDNHNYTGGSNSNQKTIHERRVYQAACEADGV